MNCRVMYIQSKVLTPMMTIIKMSVIDIVTKPLCDSDHWSKGPLSAEEM